VGWQQGLSATALGERLGRDGITVAALVRRSGGIAPRPRARATRVLSLDEREEISRGLAQGERNAAIARRLGRDRATVGRELHRHGGRARYRATVADAAAWAAARRPKPCRLGQSPRLCALVEAKLAARWSPEQIAGWLRVTYASPAMHVSHETIYRTLFIQSRGALKRQLQQSLRRRRAVRRSGPVGRVPERRGQLIDAVSIRQRPAEVADRAVPGHWEGDLLLGSHRSQIATRVERQSRYVLLVRLPNRATETVIHALTQQVQQLPDGLMRSLTWDRGKELAAHRRFTVATNVAVYFCDPQSPWQRGSNENTNGLLRQYFPKGTDVSRFSQSQLDAVARQLNERPRKTLGFHTPADKLAAIVATTS
jgi:IS30 family transposase